MMVEPLWYYIWSGLALTVTTAATITLALYARRQVKANRELVQVSQAQIAELVKAREVALIGHVFQNRITRESASGKHLGAYQWEELCLLANSGYVNKELVIGYWGKDILDAWSIIEPWMSQRKFGEEDGRHSVGKEIYKMVKEINDRRAATTDTVDKQQKDKP